MSYLVLTDHMNAQDGQLISISIHRMGGHTKDITDTAYEFDFKH